VHDPEKWAPVFGSDHAQGKLTMRTVYAIVFVIAFAALIAEHLTSPSSGRPVSPEDFAGACAPCGAPCPSVQKK
jgi:hypothetical protein